MSTKNLAGGCLVSGSGSVEAAAGQWQPTSPRHPGWVLTVLAGAQLMVVLDTTIITIAIPSIQHELHYTATTLQWVVSAYTLAFGGFLLLGGRLGDVLGRRMVFQTGAVLFVVASLLGGFADHQAWLIASRAGQGLGAALLSPTALALVATSFPEGKPRNRAVGVYGAVSGAGAAVGAVGGGVLTDLVSWRWVFFINIPLGVLVLIGSALVLAEPQRTRRRIDLPSALLVTAGVTLLVNGFINAPLSGWTAAGTLVSFGAAVVLLTGFILLQRGREHALLPLRMFASRNRSGAFVVHLLNNAALLGTYYFFSQFAQEVLGLSPLATGLAFLPSTACVILASQVGARLLGRIGPLPLIAFGAFSLALGLFYVSFMSENSTYAGLLLPALILVGLGLGSAIVPLTVTVVSGVEPRETGVASGVLNSCQQVGGSLGLAAMVTLSAHVTGVEGADRRAAEAAELTHGWGDALALGAGFALVAGIVALLAIRVRPWAKPAAPGE
ncbi:MFS transporter [Amycolatopsis anabasis]|uniref:MFS transporter n=1 Tax=Amycolatopsis anabasis TaxID=1840409 RepID=UPI00131AF164|nr:MFS transporter [Amycolatopsis anabasis]